MVEIIKSTAPKAVAAKTKAKEKRFVGVRIGYLHLITGVKGIFRGKIRRFVLFCKKRIAPQKRNDITLFPRAAKYAKNKKKPSETVYFLGGIVYNNSYTI